MQGTVIFTVTLTQRNLRNVELCKLIITEEKHGCIKVLIVIVETVVAVCNDGQNDKRYEVV